MNSELPLAGPEAADGKAESASRLEAALALNQAYLADNPHAAEKHQREQQTIADARLAALQRTTVVSDVERAGTLRDAEQIPLAGDPVGEGASTEAAASPAEADQVLDTRQDNWLTFWWPLIQKNESEDGLRYRQLAILLMRSGDVFGDDLPPFDLIADRIQGCRDLLIDAWSDVAKDTERRGDGVIPWFCLAIQIKDRAGPVGLQTSRQRFLPVELALLLKAILSKMQKTNKPAVVLAHNYFVKEKFRKTYRRITGRKLANREKLRVGLNLLEKLNFIRRENHRTRSTLDDRRFKPTVYRLGQEPARLPST